MIANFNKNQHSDRKCPPTKCRASLWKGMDITRGFRDDSDGKEPACNAGDLGSMPGSGRSPGGGNGTPLQYSCLENPVDRGAWGATVHGVAQGRAGLSDWAACTGVTQCLLENKNSTEQLVLTRCLGFLSWVLHTHRLCSTGKAASPPQAEGSQVC